MDIELNELASFLKETKENEDVKFSGIFADESQMEDIFQEGLSFEERNVGYFELSESFYNDPETTLFGSIKQNEILVIIENDEERGKLHSGYIFGCDDKNQYFDSTKIVGCINSSLEFIQNKGASLRVEKPVSLKLEK